MLFIWPPMCLGFSMSGDHLVQFFNSASFVLAKCTVLCFLKCNKRHCSAHSIHWLEPGCIRVYMVDFNSHWALIATRTCTTNDWLSTCQTFVVFDKITTSAENCSLHLIADWPHQLNGIAIWRMIPVLLSTETHRRAMTGNTKSREVARALEALLPRRRPAISVTRPEVLWKTGRATWPIPDQEGADVLRTVSCIQRHV